MYRIITPICFKVPEQGTTFAVLEGDYKGKMFVMMEYNVSDCHFLVIPEIKNQTVSKFDLKQGIKNGILEKVEVLPKELSLFLKEQFLYNKKHK